jgi:hypothetical protein
MDLGPQPRWPGVDEGLHRGVPPLGVPHKRHRHGAPNVICSLAKRKVYKSQKALQNVSPPHFEGVEREASEVTREQVKKEDIVVLQMLGDHGLGLRHVPAGRVEKVPRCHGHSRMMPEEAHAHAADRAGVLSADLRSRMGVTRR